MKITTILAALTVTMAHVALPAVAQNTTTHPQPPTPQPAPASEWTFSIAPYLWIPAMDGDITVRGRTAEVDVSSGDSFEALVDNFNMAFTLHAEARKNKFTLFGDAMYMSLENESTRPVLGSTSIEFEQGIFELGAAYALVDEPLDNSDGGSFRLEPLAGLRLQFLDQQLDASTGPISVGDDKTWVDGFVGARASYHFTERFGLFARADIGAGGSDLTWNVLGGIDFKLGERTSLLAGYRALDTDYSDGSGADAFEYDILLHGPFIAFQFRF